MERLDPGAQGSDCGAAAPWETMYSIHPHPGLPLDSDGLMLLIKGAGQGLKLWSALASLKSLSDSELLAPTQLRPT